MTRSEGDTIGTPFYSLLLAAFGLGFIIAALDSDNPIIDIVNSREASEVNDFPYNGRSATFLGIARLIEKNL